MNSAYTYQIACTTKYAEVVFFSLFLCVYLYFCFVCFNQFSHSIYCYSTLVSDTITNMQYLSLSILFSCSVTFRFVFSFSFVFICCRVAVCFCKTPYVSIHIGRVLCGFAIHKSVVLRLVR